MFFYFFFSTSLTSFQWTAHTAKREPKAKPQVAPKNCQDVQNFPFADSVWLFCQYLSDQSTFGLQTEAAEQQDKVNL